MAFEDSDDSDGLGAVLAKKNNTRYNNNNDEAAKEEVKGEAREVEVEIVVEFPD